MKVATHEKLDVSLRGLQGMKWVDANYDGKITIDDPESGRRGKDAVFEMGGIS